MTPQRFYHGTRTILKPEELTEPGLYASPNLDAAVWAAELADGEGTPRVYVVAGNMEHDPDAKAVNAPPHLRMSYRSSGPLRVIEEITEWRLYHGTRAELEPGDLIKPGHAPNFGNRDRTTTYVYFARTLDAATWGAELAAGEGSGRIYVVEPTGPIEEDPNLTNKKFRGNPTKSYRSRDPIRVVDEITDWQGHSPETLKEMKDGLERLAKLDVEPNDD